MYCKLFQTMIMDFKSFLIGALASALILVSLGAASNHVSSPALSEYRYVDESYSMFERECNRLVQQGFQPVGGMYTYSQDGTGKRFFIQAFAK